MVVQRRGRHPVEANRSVVSICTEDLNIVNGLPFRAGWPVVWAFVVQSRPGYEIGVIIKAGVGGEGHEAEPQVAK